jgi:hypothetical protein
MSDYRTQWDQYVDRASDVLNGLIADAQRTLEDGRRNLDEYQARRSTERLLARLGAAVYAAERSGGPADAVTEAMAALDDHVAQHGSADLPPVDKPGDQAAD